jgi:hypothetical protein
MPFTVKDVDMQRYVDPNHWSEVYAGLIEPACRNAGMSCLRDDEDIGSRLIADNILTKIEDANIILCDLSSHNPNVFLELGWALRADKPYVLLKDDLTTFTFDLNQQYTFEYDHRLQPIVLSKNVESLAEVLENTLRDEKHRYSVVGRLGVQSWAIEAAQSGDQQTQMLLEIQQMLRRLSTGRGDWGRAQLDAFPWTSLLRRANKILSTAMSLLEDGDQELSLRRETEVMGISGRQEIQLSVVDSDRVFVYHDWPQLVGATASFCGTDGKDIYDEVFAHPAGAVAWIDETSNVPQMALPGHTRYNIALFSSSGESRRRIVVETHFEVP